MIKTKIEHAFEDEVFFTLRKQRNNWAKIAVGCVGLAFASVICLIIILPLNETRPFVIMVDKTTGEAEKIVEVRPATLEQEDVVRQAELVSYIVDRETYDPADNQSRIINVMKRSTGSAAELLSKIWSSDYPQYPPAVYGEEVQINVTVKSISMLPPNPGNEYDVARVHITKSREERGYDVVKRSYIVTIGFKFKPNKAATLQAVWSNPLGFTALTYRIDAETVQ